MHRVQVANTHVNPVVLDYLSRSVNSSAQRPEINRALTVGTKASTFIESAAVQNTQLCMKTHLPRDSLHAHLLLALYEVSSYCISVISSMYLLMGIGSDQTQRSSAVSHGNSLLPQSDIAVDPSHGMLISPCRCLYIREWMRSGRRTIAHSRPETGLNAKENRGPVSLVVILGYLGPVVTAKFPTVRVVITIRLT